MVDLNVIGGFLGAGKTSTIRHLVHTLPATDRIAVLVNDFGESELDEILLPGRVEVEPIAGSCVCCTAPAGFVAAIGKLVASGVHRILVEPTGLARPSDLIDTLRRAPFADQVRLGPMVVVLDPHLLAARALPEEVREQAALADILVINRVDLASGAELAAARAWHASAWPGPLTVIETSFGAVPLSVLRWPEGHSVTRVIDHDHHHDDHEFLVRSFVWPPETVFARGRVLEIARTAGLLRLKGVLRTDEGPIEVQLAGGQVHESWSAWRRDSRLDVVVAPDGAAILDAVEGALAGALADAPAVSVGAVLEVGGRWFDRAALAALPDGVPDVSAVVPGRSGAAARLPAVLAAAGVARDASLVVVARDGLTTPPTRVSELDRALVVHSVGEDALPIDQGGPFRLLVPGGPEACANVKGLVRLSVR